MSVLGIICAIGAPSVQSVATAMALGTGRTTIVYSREAALRGLAATRLWRVLTWLDTALQN